MLTPAHLDPKNLLTLLVHQQRIDEKQFLACIHACRSTLHSPYGVFNHNCPLSTLLLQQVIQFWHAKIAIGCVHAAL